MKKAIGYWYSTLPTLIDRPQQRMTAEVLELLYEKLKELFLKLWHDHMRQAPPRFKQFWNRTSDVQFSTQSELYKKVKLSGKHTDWELYQKLDRDIKAAIASGKSKIQKRTLRQLTFKVRLDAVKRAKTLINGD